MRKLSFGNANSISLNYHLARGFVSRNVLRKQIRHDHIKEEIEKSNKDVHLNMNFRQQNISRFTNLEQKATGQCYGKVPKVKFPEGKQNHTKHKPL